MILVDVYVPSVNKKYNFGIDEKVKVHLAIEEIVTMICQKEQRVLKGNIVKFMLGDKGTKKVLPMNRTLEECQIITGAELILI